MRHTAVSQAIVQQIRTELDGRNLSLRALADLLGWPTSSTHRRLTGTQPLTVDDLGAIADALGVSPMHFLAAIEEAA